MSTDLQSLVEMGFPEDKSKLALSKSGNLANAIDWLGANADKDISELNTAEDAANDNPALEAGETARSMVCNECQKKFRGMSQAQFHAEKSGHTDFAESAEELAPLTEEEKTARLAELKEKLKTKRARQAEEEKIAQRRNNEINKKHTRETEDIKEDLQKKEQVKEAQKKRQEKIDDKAAKERIKAKIEADKAARKAKADEEKAMRANPDAYNPGAPSTAAAGGAAVAAPAAKAGVNHAEARLRLQTSGGNVMKTFPAETTLFEVAHALEAESGVAATSFTSNFPKKTYDATDFGLTLKEAGLVPSAALIVK
ncbi:hypothetical protein B0A48_11178 [Cryoendolithus antarcticus]|uniref:UBX domain-containing protein n=1 Tax=Cryoendolithus antarcticus TaxID=1507870 RepID=A0A1V8SUN4_9PEZI|nr:hypothetical protein B0A48_11178 [Cryoendolithus antarcticus]